MQVEQVSRDRQSLPTRGLKGSPEIWLKQKREKDAQLLGSDTSKYWIVENKLYDLREFVSMHPGGESWLTLTQGHDVTELFVVHHLNQEKARKMLQKYYVGETTNSISRFSFRQDGIYRAVKNQLLKQMPIQKIQDQTRSKMYGLIFLILFFISTFNAGTSLASENNSYCFYVYGSFSSLLLMALLGIGHNFVHHRDNQFKYAYAFTGFTHIQWQIMHCLSHHIYPNLQLDYQAAALQPFAYFLRNQPKNKFYTEMVLIVLYVFIQPINFILKAVLGPLKKKEFPCLQYFVPLSVIIIFYLLSGDLAEAIKAHLFVYGLFGFIMNRVLFCNHRTQEVWSEGAQRIQDFGEHTILSTADTDIWATGFISYLLLGGFNVHTSHHFFPTADQAAHPQILKVIQTVCREKGIKKFTSDRISCFSSLSKGLRTRIPFLRK